MKTQQSKPEEDIATHTPYESPFASSFEFKLCPNPAPACWLPILLVCLLAGHWFWTEEEGQRVRGFCSLISSVIQEGFPNDIFPKDGKEDRRGERRIGREKEGRRGGEETPTTPLRMIGGLSPWVHSCHQVLWGKTGRLPVSVLLVCDSSLL